MEVCDACGKNTFFPEQIGEAIICKKCLIKINGVIWQYHNVEKGENFEKFKNKSLELAKKNNFPEKVITELDKYLDSKYSNMKKCDVCGETKLTMEKMGKANVCKKCYSKININEFKEDTYFDRKELKEAMNKVIEQAKKNNFPKEAIDYIENKFNKKEDADWQYTIRSVTGQNLKVYNDYLIVETTDEFDDEEMTDEYQKLISDKIPVNKTKTVGGEMLNDLSHLKNPLKPKNMVKTIANVAISNINKDDTPKERSNLYIRKGKRKVIYSDYNSLYVKMPREDDEYGLIMIENSHSSNNNVTNVVFFFDNEDDEIKQVNKVISFIDDKIIDREEETPKEEKVVTNNSYDELRELKALLDEGIITQEDYDKKKKQILGL